MVGADFLNRVRERVFKWLVSSLSCLSLAEGYQPLSVSEAKCVFHLLYSIHTNAHMAKRIHHVHAGKTSGRRTTEEPANGLSLVRPSCSSVYWRLLCRLPTKLRPAEDVQKPVPDNNVSLYPYLVLRAHQPAAMPASSARLVLQGTGQVIYAGLPEERASTNLGLQGGGG